MMKIRTLSRLALGLWISFLGGFSAAQPSPQRLVFAGLRSAAARGQFNAVQVDSAGNVYVLLDQKDGVRVLKLNASCTSVLAQTVLGAMGDVGAGLALDPAGDVYVTGTTTSNALMATAGAAIPSRTGASTNSFVAKLDSSLNVLFVSFTGGSRIAATAVFATADAVFVTGSLFDANLPVTGSGVLQSPATGSSQNGFLERFSSDGSALVYATYLTGALGNTVPASVIADATDHAYVAGSTTASGYPTVAALVPTILSNVSGFLTELTSAGDGLVFSTFVPGSGLTSLAFDSGGKALLVSGSVALGQFPVDTVAAPLAPLPYQVLLRLSLDGSTVVQGTAIAPGTQSKVAAGPSSTAWIEGGVTLPLFSVAPLAESGTGYAALVSSTGEVSEVARFGGLPNASAAYASVPAVLTSVAVTPGGEVLIAGSLQPTASSSLLAAETYDVPLRGGLSSALPSTVKAAELTSATCNGSLCAGAAAYLAGVDVGVNGPALALSADDAPMITMRNLGSSAAVDLQLTTSAGSVSSNCGTSLAPGGECNALLLGGSATTFTVSASNDQGQTLAVPAFSAPASTIAYSPKELDFGIQTSGSVPVTRVVTVSNLGSASQTFRSALDSAGLSESGFSEISSDCTLAGAITMKVLAAGGTCHITLGFKASGNAANDGALQENWAIGSRDVVLTGYSQAAALSISSGSIDFGTRYADGIHSPRYLYLSNPMSVAAAHVPIQSASGSSFTVSDGCPDSIPAFTVCRLRVDYAPAQTPSKDALTLTLDGGLSVLMMGEQITQPGLGGQITNPSLSVSPGSVTFADAVTVTEVSTVSQSVGITNSGNVALPLTLAVSGDFSQVNSCGVSLPAHATCAVAITFAPSAAGARSGLLSVNAGPAYITSFVPLSGAGTALIPAPNGLLTFGSVPVGEQAVQYFKLSQTVANLSLATTGPYRVVLVQDTGFGFGHPAASAYKTSLSGACPACFVGVQFMSTGPGLQSGTVTFQSAPGGSAFTLTLTGSGAPVSGLLLTPLNEDFGTVPAHSVSGAKLFTLTNADAGGAAVDVSAPQLTGDFASSALPSGGAGCGGTLMFGASCLIEVSFTPTAVGQRTGSMTVSDANESVTAALTGFGSADPGLAISPLLLNFSAVPGASATQQSVSVTNTGNASVQIGAASTGTSSLAAVSACQVLAPRASCSILVTYTPGSTEISDVLQIPVTAVGDPDATIYTVQLTGEYTSQTAGLSLTPSSSDFGPSPTGTQASLREIVVTNLSAKAASIHLVVPRQFSVVGTPCGELDAGASCTLTVQFAPLTNDVITGTLLVQGLPLDGSPLLNGIGYLEGYGVGSGVLSITGLQGSNVLGFGQVTSGQSSAKTLTLTNVSAVPMAVRRVSSAPPFLSVTTCGGVMAAGQSCSVTVTYAPVNQVASGTASPPSTSDVGLLTIESDAGSSPDLVNLSGAAGPVGTSGPVNGSVLATYSLSEGSLAFAATAVGDVSPAQTVSLVNTGTAPLHVSSAASSADFTVVNGCGMVLAGGSCSIQVTSTPQSAGGHVGALEIASDSTNSLEFVSLVSAGTPSPLVIAPGALAFGPVLLGSSAALSVQVTNANTAAVTFASIMATGDFAVGGSCPVAGGSLAAGAACTVQITFAPSATGLRAGVLSVASSASALPLTVGLSGTGTQSQLAVAPGALAFGTVALGIASNLNVTLTNSGSGPVNGLLLAASGDYSVSVPCPSATLLPGSTCVAQVTFTPSTIGVRTGTLTVTSSDRGSPVSVALSGTGVAGAVQTGGFTLTVDGAASSSATVKSGSPASYVLAVTPSGGFNGPVALTCAALVAGQYVSCSFSAATLTLSGGTVNATVALNTITTASRAMWPERVMVCLLLPGIFACWKARRRGRRFLPGLLGVVLTALGIVLSGCGGKSPAKVASNVLETPAGTYSYSVTASSTSGVIVSRSVTLNLTVQ